MLLNRPPRVLLVDDDPMFRKLVARMAKKYNLLLTVCGSAEELHDFAVGRDFDVAILDYYLDRFHGSDVAETLVEGIPVVLMSHNEFCVEESESWPLSIRTFITKSKGVTAILDAALHLVKRGEIA